MTRTLSLTALTAGALGLAGAVHATELVSIRLRPTNQVVARCDLVYVDVVVSSEGAVPQAFDALDAILTWDPVYLELIGADDSDAEATFFISDFLPDPDNINTLLDDGEALYTAFAPPGAPVMAPPSPDELTVTSIVFRANLDILSTPVDMVPTVGTFSRTRTLLEGAEITGDISNNATVRIGTCPPDFNADGIIGFTDLVQLLSAWGPCPVSCCLEDLDNDGMVGFLDLIQVLHLWGPCP